MGTIHRQLNRALDKINKSRISVLVVEDDDTTRRLSLEVFRTAGFLKLSFARSIDEALDTMKSQRPDIILLSWGLGDEDGLDLTRQIRYSQLNGDTRIKNHDIPIILMSSRRRLYDVQTARNAGITEFIVKPFSATSLMKAVASALTRPRPFVVCDAYVGPCRRRRQSELYSGKLRRSDDRRVAAHRQAQSAFVQALLAECKTMVSLLGNEYKLRHEVHVHILERTVAALDRAKSFKLKKIVTALHSLNDYLSYWREDADLRLVKRHFFAISRLCQPSFETPEDCQNLVDSLKQTVAKEIRNGKRRA